MNRSRAVVSGLGVAVLSSSLALIGGPAATAHGVAAAPAASRVIGHLAYVTNSDHLDLVSVRANGTTSTPRRIAPTLPSTKKNPVTLGQVLASPDGRWLAWTEFRPQDSKALLVVRQNSTGNETALRTGQSPVGFAKDTLLTVFNATQRLVLSAHPHFDVVKHGRDPITGYPGGVVNQTFSHRSRDSRLMLTSYAGHHTTLHRYTDAGGPTYRTPDAAWTSGDGKHLVVERGNHQDFDGLGPSSLADEFSLHGTHARHQLGTDGPTPAGSSWRVATVTYVGHHDRVWAAWERAVGNHAVTRVASYSGGHWHTRRSGAITVSGNRAGDVVIQPGKYVEGSSPEPFPEARATSSALLRHGSTSAPLGVRGTQFFWVAG